MDLDMPVTQWELIMLINLTDVFTSEGKERVESLLYEPESFSYGSAQYKIHEKSPLTLHFSNIGKERVLMEAEMRMVLDIPCDRCLKIVKEPVEIHVAQELFSPEAAGQREDQDEQEFMHGYELDAEEFVNGEIIINIPVKVLCRPDCKGICKQCGHDLNEGECGCDTFVPDPRMAAIKDIFNGNKEV